jgi:thiol-disulfide isomerase/thioredoxin
MAEPDSFSRRTFSLRAAIALFGTTFLPDQTKALDNREPAPRFYAKSMDGETFDNDSVRGKVALIQFWATWCQFCKRDEDAVNDIAKEFAAKGLVVLAVNVGEPKKKVKKYLVDSPRTCKIVLMDDTNLAAMFTATSYPLYVLIDRDGKIADTQRGAGGEDALYRLLRKAGLEAE